MVRREEGNIMLLNKSDKALIQNLKGRISKLLSISSILKVDEKSSLEKMFSVIDQILLYNGKNPKKDGDKLRLALLTHASIMGDDSAKYIKEHIIPLVNKITTNKWGTDNG